MSSKTFYITTAIAYPNAKPHLGHVLEFIQADVIARWHRLNGEKVFFMSGTDDHGTKILRAAEKAGKTPEEFSRETGEYYRALAKEFNLSWDRFIRTTEEEHVRASQKIWDAAWQRGDIEKRTYQGLYCVGCESFKTEKDLVDGKCPEHGVAPELLSEENYFFKLTRYREALLQHYEEHPDFVVPESRLNEIKSLVRGGLNDVSVSRPKSKLSWGIPVPNDQDHVMYVWFDALTNYITGAGYADSNADKPGSRFQELWPADVHLIGKDILRFHAALWPAMLMSAGVELPRHIYVHGFITTGGQKMSKTLGNVIDPITLGKKYGVDPVRYYLLREIPSTGDGDITDEKLIERHNGDLANGLGNLTARVLTLSTEHFGEHLPDAKRSLAEHPLRRPFDEVYNAYRDAIDRFALDQTLVQVWSFIATCNAYVNETKPWSLVNHDKEELAWVLRGLLESLAALAWLLAPFLPETSEKIRSELGLDSFMEGKTPKFGAFLSGENTIKRGPLLFPRI
ncbi:MAG: methionine--tRNA ligase [Parcubacteria group bacterium]|nr:methionine--tRNA ligase [Parcubacteria group bacterium]